MQPLNINMEILGNIRSAYNKLLKIKSQKKIVIYSAYNSRVS